MAGMGLDAAVVWLEAYGLLATEPETRLAVAMIGLILMWVGGFLACYGTAMVTGLKKVFGEDFAVTLTSTGNLVTGVPVVPTRSYASLDEIVDDTANARVWAGLHFRTTMDATARWIPLVVRDALKGHFQRARNRDCR